MISVEEALAQVLALAAPVGIEEVGLAQAAGRVLAHPVTAGRDQPPFDASAMDGYALDGAAARPGATLRVIGEAGAGHGFAGRVGPGEAVRIFTGAPLPEGTDRVIIQEDVTRAGETITLGDIGAATHVRAAGGDFAAGAEITPPQSLTPSVLALLAAMNVARVPVRRRPVIALAPTGDELVMPGETPRADQIIASNIFALKAIAEAEGAEARLLPIARDTPESLRGVLALAEGADMIVTIGGASAGDHDIVGPVAAELGMERAFYKVAMRPGKPLMAGRLGAAVLLGLPGNPVSAIVCGYLFMVPALRVMLGRADPAPPLRAGVLGVDVPANGPRAHYMRATIETGDGPARVIPFERQDSALLSVLTEAQALLLRPAGDAARAAGEPARYIALGS